ncbi:hypothetical protein [Candidatus Binatus soli]|jgi:hypothetical protein|uniref:hypothetical protein n=1 Tax=Candidatus Binatus soli TaxID=1953413 RepID=UPI003D0C8499
MTDLERKKLFLYEGSVLYNTMIHLAPDDAVRRYLAFRIIVNAMAFEDLVGNRAHARQRQIRNVLLAHKQESDFFQGYTATEEIRDAAIEPLIRFIAEHPATWPPNLNMPELSNPTISPRFNALATLILQKFYDEEISGFRVTNNFLCFTGAQVHEISSDDLAGCFYRYNSSKSLMTLAMYLFKDLHPDADLKASTRHAKLDLVLHAANMADCIIKDTVNPYSIDGLREVMIREGIGDPAPLNLLAADVAYKSAYTSLRKVRNKLIGHMDPGVPLDVLLTTLDELPTANVYAFINKIDFAMYTAARSHMAIWARYATSNARMSPDVVGVAAPKPTPYF